MHKLFQFGNTDARRKSALFYSVLSFCQAQTLLIGNMFMVHRGTALWFKSSLCILFSIVEEFIEGLMAHQLHPLVNIYSLQELCLSLCISINADICWNAYCSFLILHYSEEINVIKFGK